MVNLRGAGGFSFNYASVNEYDITILNKYEYYYFCNNCNINVPKKFETTTTICKDNKPFISTSNVGNIFLTVKNTFCLYSITNISFFYIEERKINQNFYKGKTVKKICNNENDDFNIDNIFVINGNENLQIYLDVISFKIVSISNKKGKIFNGNEELFDNSFFNAKNKFLTHKKIGDEGYLMIINIKTKPLNKDISISTCQEDAIIYLYVHQKNCSMNETSENFCQKCIPDYGKYENKCYHKSEKMNNLFYDSSSQKWKECETNRNSFICSICPKGTYIKDPSSQICEKCPIGEFSSNENLNKCEKCPKGYYSNILGATNCEICPKGTFNSLMGNDHCEQCDAG